MKPDQARRFLARRGNPGEAWVAHSFQVAKVADRLGRALLQQQPDLDLDLDRVYVQALLHDVGRSVAHSPLHGWTGFVLLRARGESDAGRGCLAHWLKGRNRREMVATSDLSQGFVDRVFQSWQPDRWTLTDSLVSVADSSVANTTIVPLAQRHADLYRRYGDSRWLRRAEELALEHSQEIGQHLGRPVDSLLAPLYGQNLSLWPDSQSSA